jgi:crotonobetainyl-CoA:carnitine CoA-transferase CaiB-like acyl-CoA transferase
MTGPLDGVRVIDAATFLAAPGAATLLADLGADVIKIEPPSSISSGLGQPSANKPRVDIGRESVNHGKRSVALNLTNPTGRAILSRLCESADVLIHNFPGSRAERLGVSWEEVHAKNPRIVHATLTAYGSQGPDASRLGYDSTSFWARSGIQFLLGDVSSPPVPSLAGMGDRVTSLCLSVALLAALRQRDLTGEGQQVEVSLQRTGMWVINGVIQSELMGGATPSRPNRLEPENPIEIAYPTSDGRWLVLRALNVERDWPIFCAAVERPEWAVEFPNAEAVKASAHALRERLESLFLGQPLEYWRVRIDPSGLIWAPVESVAEVAADPQLWANGAFETVEHPVAGNIPLVSVPFAIAGADIRVRRLAPGIGANNEEVLKELGYSSEDVASFASEGAFG